MAFHVRDPETDKLVRELARRRGVGLTEAIKHAVSVDLRSSRTSRSFDKLREIQARIASRGRSGLLADKPFFDDLSGAGDD